MDTLFLERRTRRKKKATHVSISKPRRGKCGTVNLRLVILRRKDVKFCHANLEEGIYSRCFGVFLGLRQRLKP